VFDDRFLPTVRADMFNHARPVRLAARTNGARSRQARAHRTIENGRASENGHTHVFRSDGGTAIRSDARVMSEKKDYEAHRLPAG
jgi:hypothetical protein